MLDGVDAVEPFVIILDGFQVAGNFDALGERVLGGLEHLVTDAILQAGQEELVLDEFEGISDSFRFDLGFGSSGGDGDTHCSHGSRFFIGQALVGHLDAIRVVVNGLLQFLIQIGEVGARRLCRVFWFVSLQEFGLDDVPVVGVNSILSEALEPTDGLVSETHLELQELTGVVPAGNGTGVIDADDEQSSGDGVSPLLAVVERNIRRSLSAVMIVQDLSEVLSGGDVDDGSRVGHVATVAVAVLRV